MDGISAHPAGVLQNVPTLVHNQIISKMKNLRAIGWVLLLALTLPFNSACIKAQTNHNFELVKNLDIFTALYRELDRNYVDTLNS